MQRKKKKKRNILSLRIEIYNRSAYSNSFNENTIEYNKTNKQNNKINPRNKRALISADTYLFETVQTKEFTKVTSF